MEQTIQAPRLEAPGMSSHIPWIQHFFTPDLSQENRPAVDLQRRAVWFAVAIILQALHEPAFDSLRVFHEAHPTGGITVLIPIGLGISCGLIPCSFWASWMAVRRASPKQEEAA